MSGRHYRRREEGWVGEREEGRAAAAGSPPPSSVCVCVCVCVCVRARACAGIFQCVLEKRECVKQTAEMRLRESCMRVREEGREH